MKSPKLEIVIASTNKNKITELQTILKNYPLLLLSPSEICQRKNLPPPPEVEETANTYVGNALLKARSYFEWSLMPVLADDSGLEIEDLENRPGINSARYAGVGASDSDKMNKVLEELSVIEKQRGVTLSRRASFCCALVFIEEGGAEHISESRMRGTVLNQKVGQGGFGYDPIIRIDDLGKTLAEIDFETTCKVGFRAQAATALFDRYLAVER